MFLLRLLSDHDADILPNGSNYFQIRCVLTMNYPNEELRAILRLEQQYCETVEDLASTWMMNEGCQPRQRGTINSVTITVYSILATLLLDFLEASAIPTFSRSNTAAVHVFSTEPSPDFGVFVLSSSVAADGCLWAAILYESSVGFG